MRDGSARNQLLHVHASQVQMRELRSYIGQTQLARRDLVTEGAAELLEAGGLLTLLGRAPVIRHLRNKCHGFEHRDAAFKILPHLLSSGSEAQFSVLAHRVTAFATVSVE